MHTANFSITLYLSCTSYFIFSLLIYTCLKCHVPMHPYMYMYFLLHANLYPHPLYLLIIQTIHLLICLCIIMYVHTYYTNITIYICFYLSCYNINFILSPGRRSDENGVMWPRQNQMLHPQSYYGTMPSPKQWRRSQESPLLIIAKGNLSLTLNYMLCLMLHTENSHLMCITKSTYYELIFCICMDSKFSNENVKLLQ